MTLHPVKQLSIHVLFLRRRICLLIMMALFILILSGGFAAAGSSQMEEGRFAPISLSIVADPRDETAQMILAQLSRMPQFFPHITIQVSKTEADARALVTSGEVAGALILPPDFYAWINGRGIAVPVLLVSSLSGIEHAVFRTIGNSMLRMLADAQRGVALVTQAVRLLAPAHITYDTAWREINLRYFSVAFDQSSRFEEIVVSGPESFSFATHYIFCIGLCFCLLATPLLHEPLSLQQHSLWIRRLGSVGFSPVRYALGQLLVTAAGYALMLLLLSGGFFLVLTMLGEAMRLSPLLLPTIAAAGLFLAGLTFLLANLNSPVLGGLLTCLVALFSLLIAGGLLPKVLLPSVLQALSPWSPILWLRNLLGASLLGMGTPFGGSFLAICLLTAVIWGLCLLQCRHFRRACL